jgi:opacity protein-like surface antigen
MKKIFFVLICLSFFLKVQSQIWWDKHWDIKAHEVGQLHFQLGVALPTPHWNSDSNSIDVYTNRTDNKAFEKYNKENEYDLFGAGPIFARFEYAFNRKLSVNAGITYTNYQVRFSRDSLDKTIGVMIPYEYGIKVNNLSYMVRLNYHLYVDTRWDLYCGGGLGYDSYTATNYTKYTPQALLFNGNFKKPAPVTFEAGAGLRYFFLNRTAFYIEYGYGKTNLHAGVLVKVSQPRLNRSY